MASKASKQIRKGLRIHVTVLACIPDGDPMVESCEDARTWPKPTHRDCARVGRAAERLFGSCLADVELAFRQLPYSRLRFLPHQPHRPCMPPPAVGLASLVSYQQTALLSMSSRSNLDFGNGNSKTLFSSPSCRNLDTRLQVCSVSF